jgi:uncharacterized protein (TIGR04255 family)
VIAQVRFPLIAAFARLDALGPFQNALRDTYPILRPEQSQALLFGPQGIEVQPAPATVWRFHDKQDLWRVSLTTEFVALETKRYPGRDEFLKRLESVLAALQSSANPAVYDRLGIRYVNRISGSALGDISKLVRPEVVGITGTQFSAKLVHSLTENSFAAAHGRLNVRWGLLPKGATPDPTAIDPAPADSWLLDLDMSTGAQEEFEIEAVVKKARTFSSTIYSFFRWSVEDEFLRRFGGDA